MEFEPIELGDRVKDPITKVQGIAVCITTWLHGCIRIGVQAEESKEGKPPDAHYFDQSQLVMVKKNVHQPMTLGVLPAQPAEPRRSSGGPARESGGFRRNN